jgi:2-dehydro-3-deoxyglucarate aldolase
MTSPTPSPFPNRLRQDLLAHKRLIGCWCALGSLVTTEVVGVAGFDWLLLDAEHAPNDVLTLIPQLLALKGSTSAPVVRIPTNEPIVIKRLLDAGFQNFLVPFVETPEQARRAVAATRYPPAGIRGVSVSQRANRYGSVADYFRLANDHIAVIVQIESRAGVDNAAEIAQVEGIDALFIGPSDLAAGLGHLGDSNHPDVQAAIAHILAAATAAGKTTGILAPAEADARRYLEMGVKLVAVGSDVGVLRAGSQALLDKYR